MKKIIYILVLITFMLCINKINAYTEYKVGDIVPYNGMDFYVIKDSSSKDDSVTMLKAEPITSSEISSYLPSTEIASKVDTSGTYAAMAYYSKANCVSAGDQSGCSTDYTVSDVKQLVDMWKTNYASSASEARLITLDELVDNFGYEYDDSNPTSKSYNKTVITPIWVYNSNYFYWTMSQYLDSSFDVWYVNGNGVISSNYVGNSYNSDHAVRPVIILSKIVLGDEDESAIDSKQESDNKSDSQISTNETKTNVKVANTYMSNSVLKLYWVL